MQNNFGRGILGPYPFPPPTVLAVRPFQQNVAPALPAAAAPLPSISGDDSHSLSPTWSTAAAFSSDNSNSISPAGSTTVSISSDDDSDALAPPTPSALSWRRARLGRAETDATRATYYAVLASSFGLFASDSGTYVDGWNFEDFRDERKRYQLEDADHVTALLALNCSQAYRRIETLLWSTITHWTHESPRRNFGMHLLPFLTHFLTVAKWNVRSRRVSMLYVETLLGPIDLIARTSEDGTFFPDIKFEQLLDVAADKAYENNQPIGAAHLLSKRFVVQYTKRRAPRILFHLACLHVEPAVAVYGRIYLDLQAICEAVDKDVEFRRQF